MRDLVGVKNEDWVHNYGRQTEFFRRKRQITTDNFEPLSQIITDILWGIFEKIIQDFLD